LEPTERFVDLDSPSVRLRALEVGSGRPILFIHGGVWPGTVFASLIRKLSGFRCLNWHVALMRETKTMRNERALIRATLGRGGWRTEVTFEGQDLALLQQPMLYVYGTNDPESTVDQVRHLVGMLPNAELHLVGGGGHLPWLDDPGQVGARVGGFLAG
jgi:pimeloyl-ACP methyl ester carboxylesterase